MHEMWDHVMLANNVRMESVVLLRGQRMELDMNSHGQLNNTPSTYRRGVRI